MTIYLQHVAGDAADKVEAFETDRVRIGRNADNDLVFDAEKDRLVGRYHAEIYRDGVRYFVKDLQSRNGTFVDGRRIEEPTPVTDGQVIQFGPGGPARRFSVRAPGSYSPPSAPSAPGRRRPTVVVLVAVVGSALLVGAAVGYIWESWWAFFAGFVATVAVGALALWAWTWWRARRDRAAAAPPSAEAGHQSRTQRDLDESWAKGIAVLRQSNLRNRGEDPVHALPWYLLIGDARSGRGATVRAARPLPSSVAAQRDARPPTTCDWWFFEQCVVLDVSDRYLSQADQVGDAAEWRRFLGLVRRTRRRPPLNGVLVTVPVEMLIDETAERLQERADQIRRRLDEVARELGVASPVYLLISRLNALAGFAQFFVRLPDGAIDQAMGAMNERLHGEGEAGPVVEDMITTVAERLDAFRLALLNDAETASVEDAADVFLFVEEFKALARPFRTFTDALLRRNPYHETPLLRGIYFASAASAEPAPVRSAMRAAL